MKWNRRLSRAIRKNARQRLRASQALWKDYKRMRWSRWKRLRLGRWVVMLYPLLFLVGLGQRASNELLLVLLTLYCTATVFSRSTSFVRTLYRSADLAFFMHVPVTDQHFFDFEWPRFLRSSLFVYCSAGAVFVVLAFRQGQPYTANLLAVLIAATLQWLVVVAFSVMLQLLPPRFMDLRVGVPIYALGFAAVFFPAGWVQNLATVVQPMPTAWVPTVFERGVLGHDTSTLSRVLGVVLLVALLPFGYQRMRKAFPRFELVYPLQNARVSEVEEISASVRGQRDGTVDGVGRELESADRALSPPPAPIDLPALNWATAGWIERLAGRRLNLRERYAAVFLCGGRLGRWSSEWRLGLKIAAGGVGTMLLAILLPGMLPWWVSFGAGAVASLRALPVLGGGWEGMQLVTGSGTVGPAYAGLPLSYSEITRVLIKINLVRFAVWAPFFLAYAAALAMVNALPWVVGFRMGLEILAVLLSSQWIFIMGKHANGTNDTKRVTWHSLVGLAVATFIGLAYLASVGFFFFAVGWTAQADWEMAAAALIGMVLFSWLTWATYKALYDHGRIDLMRLPG